MAGPSTVDSGSVPWSRSSNSHASTAPGTAAANGPEPGTWSRPIAANASRVAPAGAVPCPHSTRGVGSAAVATMAGRSPPGPLRCGSTTCSTKPPAAAASKAFPPSSSIRCADCEAIQCVEDTIAKLPLRVGREVKAGCPLACIRPWCQPRKPPPIRPGSGYPLSGAQGSGQPNSGGRHDAQHHAGRSAHHRLADEARHHGACRLRGGHRHGGGQPHDHLRPARPTRGPTGQRPARRSASRATSGSRPSSGTTPSTSRPTSQCPRWVRCCTR